MKKTNKVIAVVLAVVLALAMGITAFAAGNRTITIMNDAPNHKYEAYQVFAGDVVIKDGKKVLSNVKWGSGITDVGKAALGDAETKLASLKTEDDAKAFAKAVAPYLTNAKESGAQANGKYTISGLDDGYYLVKDKDNSLTTEDDFYTAYIMKVVGADVETQPKGEKPTLDKQIKHNESNTWGVVGDNQIGDTIEFRTISTVPKNTENYTTYKYEIHDTMSAGLTSNVKTADDVKILVNDKGEALSKDYYTLTADGNSFVISVKIKEAIAAGVMKAGDELYVYYTGTLNKDALIYDEGSQNNVAHLEYSNNPNDDSSTGKTPEKKVYDWTFKMEFNKVDGKDTSKKLEGARFVLSKNGTLKVSDMNCDINGVPANTTDLIPLVKVSDGVYRVATSEDAAETFVYAFEAGTAVVKGLDDSIQYYLYETKAPDGYNLLKNPVSFKINADYNESGSALKEGYPTVIVNDSDPSTTLSTDIKNNSGSELPETGGIGTTIFYIVGGILLAAAGILLITKKRMSHAA